MDYIVNIHIKPGSVFPTGMQVGLSVKLFENGVSTFFGCDHVTAQGVIPADTAIILDEPLRPGQDNASAAAMHSVGLPAFA